jgi:hypothetical protein
MAKKGKKAKRDKRANTAAYGYNDTAPGGGGLFSSLSKLLPSRRSDQFLLGLLLGAAAIHVLSDEKTREKLIRAGIRLYSGLMGGVEEIKEQFADIQAELDAEDTADA